MRTIEERAENYADLNYIGVGNYNSHKDLAKAYTRGAIDEHTELTSWRDPPQELPPKDINSGASYLLKIVDEDGDTLYRVGSRMPNSNKFFYPTTTKVSTVIGWRPIED